MYFRMSAQERGNMAVERFESFHKKRERVNVHECLRVEVASWKICLFVTALFLWQRLLRRGAENYKPLCALDPLCSLICFEFVLQGWHYAAHRPSWPTKGTHKTRQLIAVVLPQRYGKRKERKKWEIKQHQRLRFQIIHKPWEDS